MSQILVCTITPHRIPSSLTEAERRRFVDRFLTVAAMMACELSKGEPWVRERDVWIEGDE